MQCIDCIIYLDCDVGKVIKRLKKRNQNEENHVSIKYQYEK